jgi:hypothetical protein
VKKLMKCYITSTVLYGAETWTLRKLDRKYPGSSEMRCQKRMQKIRWTDHLRNEEVLHTFNENMNILHEIKGRKE